RAANGSKPAYLWVLAPPKRATRDFKRGHALNRSPDREATRSGLVTGASSGMSKTTRTVASLPEIKLTNIKTGRRGTERLANRYCLPCAEHVTWTRQHRMIRHQKPLILMVLLGMIAKRANWANSRMQKPANVLTLRAFRLVAG